MFIIITVSILETITSVLFFENLMFIWLQSNLKGRSSLPLFKLLVHNAILTKMKIVYGKGSSIFECQYKWIFIYITVSIVTINLIFIWIQSNLKWRSSKPLFKLLDIVVHNVISTKMKIRSRIGSLILKCQHPEGGESYPL